MKKYQAVTDHVIVRMPNVEEGSGPLKVGGIILPDSARDAYEDKERGPLIKGRVESVGPNCTTVKENDLVIFNRHMQEPFVIDNEKIYCLCESAILAVVVNQGENVKFKEKKT